LAKPKKRALDRAKRTNDAPHWSLKFEYDYLGLGNRTFVIPATAPLLAGDTFTSNNRNVQMVKVGINYLFN
jgi:outer membrane immunogenic protein